MFREEEEKAGVPFYIGIPGGQGDGGGDGRQDGGRREDEDGQGGGKHTKYCRCPTGDYFIEVEGSRFCNEIVCPHDGRRLVEP